MYGNDSSHNLFSARVPKGYDAAMIYAENNFEIKFVQYGTTKDSNDELFGYAGSYRYQIENFQPAIQFPYTIKYLDVSETKDQLRLYSTNILLDFFFPKSN